MSIIVAQQAQGILSNPNIQLALIGGGGLLAYWWYKNNLDDPDMCIPGLGGGIGGDIVKEACKVPGVLKDAGADALGYFSKLPDRLATAVSGNVYLQSELTAEVQQSNNIFDKVGFVTADFLTGGTMTRVAEGFKTLDAGIEGTQVDPDLTRKYMAKYLYWYDKLKNNQWLNQEALRRTGPFANFDMGIDDIVKQVEKETGGELKLVEVGSSYAEQGGRTFYLGGRTDNGEYVKTGTRWGISTGWYGLIKMYWESQHSGRYFEDIDMREQRAYILSLYGSLRNKQFPIVLWGSGQSVPSFFEYYKIEYDIEKQYLVQTE